MPMERKRKEKATAEERAVFAARLRAARTALGLTRAQAAYEWYISRRTLEAWEAGRKLPAPRYRGDIDDIINNVESAQAARKAA